jgi:hypothetical protein
VATPGTGLGSQKRVCRAAETAPYTTREQAATTSLGSVGRGVLYIKYFFTKRTQLKNAYVSRHETVMKKTELGSFCKKEEKMGKKVPKYRSGRVVLCTKEAKKGRRQGGVLECWSHVKRGECWSVGGKAGQAVATWWGDGWVRNGAIPTRQASRPTITDGSKRRTNTPAELRKRHASRRRGYNINWRAVDTPGHA